MSTKLETLLGAVGMTLAEAMCPGLVQADDQTLARKRKAGAPLEEIVALERAIHFRAHYVYFRRLGDRAPMAVAYLYDGTEGLGLARRRNSRRGKEPVRALGEELSELHTAVWSACEIPLTYVFLPTEVQIYHILKGPRASEDGIEADPWDTIQLGEELAEGLERLKAYSASKLDDGTFWEDSADPRLTLGGAAFMALSQEIEGCRVELTDRRRIDPDLVKRLLIIFVMIKYLEERRDQDDQRVFPEGTFERFHPDAKGFVGLLRAGGTKVLAFLDHLAEKDRFNGDVFRLEAHERMALETTDLRPFADLLGARIDKGQYTLWERYAFNELPVELISHLYEQFLPNQPGVVYTPPFLVNFILDEALPLSQSTPDSFRLIDFSCGSGVFLVGAFKRLVHRWRRDNAFRDPDVDTLKGILRRHIFGVDIQGEAVRLTMFSLCVALCDSLRPRVIWDDLHFDRLKDANLFEGDFFERVEQWRGEAGFDLIVGNPPFVSDLTPAGEAELASIKAEEPDFELPDRQVALLFLKSAIRIAKDNGQIALVQPAAPLLYNQGSGEFRRQVLEKTQVTQIVDLTHLSRVLFKRPWHSKPTPRSGGAQVGRTARTADAASKKKGSGNPADFPVVAIFVENRVPDDEPLLHVTVRRTVQAEQKLMFEIDHYDLHFIPYKEALDDPFVWKANFIGGGRIPHLVRRLRHLGQLQDLGKFLRKAKRDRNWAFGEGYTEGDPEKGLRKEALQAKHLASGLSVEEGDEFRKLRYRAGPWLTGRDVLPTEAFTVEGGVELGQKVKITSRFFAEPRHEGLFAGPVLLIKEVIEATTERIPVALLEEGICFQKAIFGVHAPASELGLLERIRDVVSDHQLSRFYLLATSGAYLISKSSAVRQADILRLPFPDSAEELELSPIEQALIDDALEHVADFKRHGGESAVQRPPSDEQLHQFGEFFCRVLGSVYTSLRAEEPVRFQGGICYPFYFGSAPSRRFGPADPETVKLENLLTKEVSPSLRCQRILRVFEGNMVLLVKPAQLRYWLRSTAIRDADEIFAELRGRGH